MYSLLLLLLLLLYPAPLLTPAGTVDMDDVGQTEVAAVRKDVVLLAAVGGLLVLVVGSAGKKI